LGMLYDFGIVSGIGFPHYLPGTSSKVARLPPSPISIHMALSENRLPHTIL